MRKKWAYPPNASGSYGRLTEKICVHFNFLKNSLQVIFFGFFTSFNISAMLLGLPMHLAGFSQVKFILKHCKNFDCHFH